MLTTSPATIPSPRSGRAPRATTASPVVTAARTATSSPSPRSSSIVSRIRSAARTARSASSSWAIGRPEHGHDGVADELLDRPAEPLDVGLHALVVRAQRRADVLRIGPVRAIREADEIDEQHRYDLALLADGRLSGELAPAREAEARSLGILLAAGRADDHDSPSVGDGSSSSSASRRCSTLRERTPSRRSRSSTTGTRSASSVSRKRKASSSETSGPIVK